MRKCCCSTWLKNYLATDSRGFTRIIHEKFIRDNPRDPWLCFASLFRMQRPALVTVISILFFLAAIYLWTIGVVKLFAPDAVSLMSGSQLMYGLELAGPYMALLVGTVWGLIGWGLFRLHNWARLVTVAVMVLGVAWLVPRISQAELGAPVLGYGLQIALRAAAAWYLAQSAAVIESFKSKVK